MQINLKEKTIYCSICNKWLNQYSIYLPDGSENKGRVCCLNCDNILGYTWDKEWKLLIGEENE